MEKENVTDFIVILKSNHMTTGNTVKSGDWLNCEKIEGFNFQDGRVHILKDSEGNIWVRRAEMKDGFIYLNCDNPEFANENWVYSPETIQQDFTQIALVHSYGRIM